MVQPGAAWAGPGRGYLARPGRGPGFWLLVRGLAWPGRAGLVRGFGWVCLVLVRLARSWCRVWPGLAGPGQDLTGAGHWPGRLGGLIGRSVLGLGRVCPVWSGLIGPESDLV